MNKNLEIEYKAQMQNDVPDLWDRIEAGLEEKTPATKNEKVYTYNKRKKLYTLGGGVLAAGLCLAVGLPIFFGAGNSSKSETAVADMTPADFAATLSETTAEMNKSEYFNAVDSVVQEENMIEEVELEGKMLRVTVQIISVSEVDGVVEYQAKVLDEETGSMEDDMIIRLRENENVDKLDLQQEYMLSIQDIEEAYYMIQKIEEKILK